VNATEFKARAAFVAHLRTFTEIPFAKKIAANAHFQALFEEYPFVMSNEFTNEAPRFEARFQSLSHLVEVRGTDRIVELATGFSSRGLIMTSDSKISYLETDLSPTINEKREIVEQILLQESTSRDNLRFAELDVFDARHWRQLTAPDFRNVTIINEGLLAYFRPDQIEIIATHIRDVLVETGGIWITPDFTTFRKRSRISKKVIEIFSSSQDDPIDKNAFESEDHIYNVLSEVGFSIEAFFQENLISKLNSAAKLQLPMDYVGKLLKDKKIYCLKIKDAH